MCVRFLRSMLLRAAGLGLSILMVAALSAPPAAAREVYLVKDDPGGSVPERIAQIETLAQRGASVRIGPGYCMSSCTMMIGARDACVHPNASLGFHGPSSQIYGLGLPPDEFERWSREMARYYPPPLRRWFMETARYRLTGFFVLSGRDVISMGARACA